MRQASSSDNVDRTRSSRQCNKSRKQTKQCKGKIWPAITPNVEKNSLNLGPGKRATRKCGIGQKQCQLAGNIPRWLSESAGGTYRQLPRTPALDWMGRVVPGRPAPVGLSAFQQEGTGTGRC